MATLLSVDLTGMGDGSIRCPVLVVAGRGNPLFSPREVHEHIVAPHKELPILESKVHLLFNEDLDMVLPPLLDRLAHLESKAPSASRSALGRLIWRIRRFPDRRQAATARPFQRDDLWRQRHAEEKMLRQRHVA